jgi:hypothetical protein
MANENRYSSLKDSILKEQSVVAESVARLEEGSKLATEQQAPGTINTTKGYLPITTLRIVDIEGKLNHDGSVRTTATEWYLGDELVRRDVHINILRGQSIFAKQGNG